MKYTSKPKHIAIYEIYDGPTCITQGATPTEAINAAIDFYETVMSEDGIYGEYKQDAILVWHNARGKEHREEIVLSLTIEPDPYDGGRAHYYAGRLN